MKATTLTALKAIFESDPARTRADRETLLQTLGIGAAHTMDVPAPSDRLVTFDEAARLLNRTPKSIHMLARRGLIRKATLPGYTRSSGILSSDLESLMQRMVGNGGACA
jgi:hypothetical protein